jgi:hypothetical protein
MRKNLFLIIAIIILVILGGFHFFSSREQQIACTLEAKICPDGSSVGRVAPRCDFAPCPGEKEGILVSSPKRNETIKSPLIIEGEAKGFWFFEAQFTAELYDAKGNFLGRAILTAQKNWMSEDFVPFEGNLIFTQPQSPNGVLRFLSDNPSGLEENQKVFEVPVQFELIPTQKILLYYYNPEKDKDETGNIKCSKDGLIAIEREIPITQTPIKDTLNLLLKGKQNLTQEDIDKGITTEYPLEGFKLKSVNLKPGGTLILEFEDPLNKTIGGSCRVGILWSQIEATAKQFPEVKQVKFLPEELFQP